MMLMAQERSFRHTILPEHRDAWDEMLERTGIPQSQVLNRLIGLVCGLDPSAQAMLLGLIPADDDFMRLVLTRASAPKAVNRGKPRLKPSDPDKKR